jgi:ubiquinone/menaquinone biosynthesis C-methylase UbiE
VFEPYVHDLLQRVDIARTKSILELACGTGRVTSHLCELADGTAKITATDINEDMLAVAKARVPDQSIVWQVADATALPFEEASFDLLICQFGVMFFPDKKAAFKEAYRVLTATGQLLFNVWDAVQHNEGSELIREVLDELFEDEAPDFLNKGAYSYHDEPEIMNTLLSAGFSRVNRQKVTKTITFASVDDFIKGFFDGSPLSLFFSARDANARMNAENRIKERLASLTIDSTYSYSVRALIFEVEK